MSEKTRTVLSPQYIQNFKCIGTACEDSCCIGWRVDIDLNTYKKYQKVRDEELTPLLDKYITRNRSSNHSDGNYAKVKLLEDGKCPFLNEEMLCSMQLKRGEEALSEVCSTYPRIVNVINGAYERSATLSCPEAARLALLEPAGIEFNEAEESKTVKNMIKENINTNDPKLKNKPQQFLWELRIFTISLLKDCNYSLSERLIILGMFFQKLQTYVSEGKVCEIPELIASYTSEIENDFFRASLQAIPARYDIQIELLKEIAEARFSTEMNNKRYYECFSEFINGIQYTPEAKLEEIGQKYQDAFKDYYEPFISEHGYILENYLVNHVFRTLFPFSGEKSLFDSYMMLVLNYALIKMHLIGMAGFHMGLTVELTIKLIQSFAKAVEHSQQYLNGIADQMRQNGFNTMPYMAILIKN